VALEGREVSEEKNSVRPPQFRARFDEMSDALDVAGHGEDAETVETEAGPVDALPPRGFVSEQFALEG